MEAKAGGWLVEASLRNFSDPVSKKKKKDWEIELSGKAPWVQRPVSTPQQQKTETTIKNNPKRDKRFNSLSTFEWLKDNTCYVSIQTSWISQNWFQFECNVIQRNYELQLSNSPNLLSVNIIPHFWDSRTCIESFNTCINRNNYFRLIKAIKIYHQHHLNLIQKGSYSHKLRLNLIEIKRLNRFLDIFIQPRYLFNRMLCNHENVCSSVPAKRLKRYKIYATMQVANLRWVPKLCFLWIFCIIWIFFFQ